MQQPAGIGAKPFLARIGLALASILLPAALPAQTVAFPVGSADAGAPDWRLTRFNLARLTAADAPDRHADAGGDAEVAPGLVAGVGAMDRRRGAATALDAVAPAFQRQAEVSGRLGLLVGGNGLLFGRLGYAEFDLGEAFSRSDARAFSAGGVLVGGGAEARLSPALSLRTEYHAVSYRSDLADRQLLGGLAWRY